LKQVSIKKIIDAENMAAPWSRQVSCEVEERRFESFNAIHWNENKLVLNISNLNNKKSNPGAKIC
jgi:hypothetical protein